MGGHRAVLLMKGKHTAVLRRRGGCKAVLRREVEGRAVLRNPEMHTSLSLIAQQFDVLLITCYHITRLVEVEASHVHLCRACFHIYCKRC